MRPVLLAALILSAPAHAATPARIDHILIGAADLDEGVREMERLTGVRATPGGSHPGRGTRNALMSLGQGRYLEIIAPDPGQTLPAGEFSGLLTLARLIPVGWAVSGNAAAIRATLTTSRQPLGPNEPGKRRTPSGGTLSWLTFGYPEPHHSLAPFFIEWRSQPHPSATSPAGCTLARLTLAAPDADKLRALLAPLALPVAVETAAERAMRVDLDCPKGRVQLRG